MKRVFLYSFARVTALMLIALFCATGCKDAQSTKSKAMASWVGASTGAVIAAWGAPTKTYSNGQSGRVLCYLNVAQFVTFNQMYADSPAGTAGYVGASNEVVYKKSDIDEYRFYRVFFTEADGTVYDWAWRGNQDKEETEGESH